MKTKMIINPAFQLLFIAAVSFLMQGCCVTQLGGIAKRCNCTENDTGIDIAATISLTNEPQIQQIQAVAHPQASAQIGFANFGTAETEPATAQWTIFSNQSASPLSKTNEPQIKKTEISLPAQETTMNKKGSIANQSTQQKKLPAAIRSIKSHIVAGPNLTFKNSDGEAKKTPGVGYTFGIGSTIAFSNKFSISPSLRFKQMNASEKYTYDIPDDNGDSNDREYKTSYSYNYLTIPVWAQLHINSQLSAIVGPELNFLLSARSKTTGGEKTNIRKSSAALGAGVQLGLKYAIPSAKGGSVWGLQLIYDQRISRLNKKGEDGGSYNMKSGCMSGFQLGITCSICNEKNKQ